LGETAPLEVGTGEVKAAASGVLRASALGSCVAVALVDPGCGVGGVAHIMLPGSRPSRRPELETEGSEPDYRYAEDAIQKLDRAVAKLGGKRSRSTAMLVGGGNILRASGDNVGELVLASVRKALDRLSIRIGPTHVGGIHRRSLTLDLGSGCVYFTVGDSPQELLWKPTY
jgi:chemotaxis protein CheD